MADEFTLKIKRLPAQDPRLGRHVVHDSRSLRYQVRARDPRKLASIRHRINIPIMDQGDVGSCTGHAGTNVIATDAFENEAKIMIGAAPHVFAVQLYSDATVLDPWPGQYVPDDTGSDGLSVAKVLLARGLVSGYQHATSLEAALTALAERPVMIGSSWRESMYEPDATGRIVASGSNAGGHEYALDELDVENRRVWMRNSWGPDWGVQGRAWMTFDDLGKLLADDGDCTVLVPLSQPAPQPTPVPVPATPGRTEEALLAVALAKFTHTHASPAYLTRAATAWLATISKGETK